ncbi:MAG: hypothetical protein Q8916_05275 [Bacteroidota bacterium]|nr:hypothetical protein [Bacteroidota bacterium]MDP4229800.1 hypothetical protein [Bacteroidota bacterium]MDP4236296.1 hypothetical protein [Bacteroidota bacterium]
MKRIFGLLLFLLLSFSSLSAQIPKAIGFQGVVRTPNDSFPQGLHLVYYSLYSSATSADPVYLEIQKPRLTGGVFSGLLGTQRPIPDSVTFDKPYWLGISVDNENALTPRFQLTSVPYALHATMADGLAPDFQLPATRIGVPVPISGTARGDLSGSYPAPLVSGIQSNPVLPETPKDEDILWWNGATWSPRPSAVHSSFNIVASDSQSFVNDSLTIVKFSGQKTVAAYNIGGNFDQASNSFTAPADGFYHFDVFLIFSEIAFVTVGFQTAAFPIIGSQEFQSNIIEYHTSIPLLLGEKVRLFVKSTRYLNSARWSGFKIN